MGARTAERTWCSFHTLRRWWSSAKWSIESQPRLSSSSIGRQRGSFWMFTRPQLTPLMRPPQPEPNAAVKAPPTAKEPATFSLIPGCYMGNVPPQEANLPATCDIARAVSVQY